MENRGVFKPPDCLHTNIQPDSLLTLLTHTCFPQVSDTWN